MATSECVRGVGETYLSLPEGDLTIETYFPEGWSAGDRRTGVVVVPGGGWWKKCFAQHMPVAQELAKRGYVVFMPDYRIAIKDAPRASIENRCMPDVRSAMRWVRANAQRFGVDANRIAGFGTSAGAQLIAGAALIDGVSHQTDDRTISPAADLLILNTPAMDFRVGGALHEAYSSLIRDPFACSPHMHMTSDAPPALLIATETGDRFAECTPAYCAAAKEHGVEAVDLRFDLDGGHVFWPRGCPANNGEGFRLLMNATFEWLGSHGFGPNGKPLSALARDTDR